MNDYVSIQQDSPAWQFFVKLSFGLALVTTSLGVFYLPVDFWIRGYLFIGLYFTIASALTMSKTMRDEHEAKRLIKKLGEAKTEKMLKEYELST